MICVVCKKRPICIGERAQRVGHSIYFCSKPKDHTIQSLKIASSCFLIKTEYIIMSSIKKIQRIGGLSVISFYYLSRKDITSCGFCLLHVCVSFRHKVILF